MVSPEVAALRSAVAGLDRLDPDLASAGNLVDDLTEVYLLQRRLDAQRNRLLAAAGERDALVDVCGRSPRSWLIEEQLLNPQQASAQVALMLGLASCPHLATAYFDGEISADHALVVIKALRSVPPEFREAVELALLGAARNEPPYVVARMVDAVLVQLGIESSSDEAYARRHSERGVTAAETFGGTGSLSGTLTPLAMAKWRRWADQAATPAGPEDERTRAQRVHDALEDLLDRALAGDGEEAGQPVQIVVTIPLETLESELSQRWGLLDGGLPISPATARRLACDAEILPAVLNARGDVLDMAVGSRSFSTAVKRAALLRDGGRCGFPGCKRRVKECHHIIWWSRGGKSTLDNAVWLCGFHHWLAHEAGWSLRRNADGSYTWTSKSGREVTGQPPPRHPLAA